MNKLLKTIAATILSTLLLSGVAMSEFNIGVSGMFGAVETEGTEHENSGGSVITAAEKNNLTITEMFAGGSVFAEFITDGGWGFGIDWVPVDADLGNGTRVDTIAVAPGDTGTRTASAELQDLYTIYMSKSFGDNGWYGLLGYHDATIATTETLNASVYPNADLNGVQYGIGKKSPLGNGEIRYELSYSDFDDISILDSTNSTNKITANADAYMFKVGISF